MLGNQTEWCQNRKDDSKKGSSGDELPGEVIMDAVPRVLRGGAFGCPETLVRCAQRFFSVPPTRNAGVGLRVVRTCD